ncbi:MAG: LD-carboxypeptidase [Microcoleaceae cyanobacterium]
MLPIKSMKDFNPLKPGDRLRVITPSGALRESERFQAGIEIWRSRGYQIELSAGYDRQWGYLGGNDQHRQGQLAEAFNDPDCRGILCSRGGYGATRLLEGWQYTPQLPPKYLIGFSDITALLWGLNQSIIGVHGPVLTTLAQEPDWSIQRLFDWVNGRSLSALKGIGWGGGQVQGWLFPGNLTVATCLLGTPYQPNLTDAILAFEDVNEEPYRIDRMLTQWRMVGAFQGVRGIALGRFSQWEKNINSNSFKVEEVLRDRLGDLNIPIVSDLPFGHDGCNAVLPVGVKVDLDGDRGQLSFT